MLYSFGGPAHSGAATLSSLRTVATWLWFTQVLGETAADLRTHVLPFRGEPATIREGDQRRDTG